MLEACIQISISLCRSILLTSCGQNDAICYYQQNTDIRCFHQTDAIWNFHKDYELFSQFHSPRLHPHSSLEVICCIVESFCPWELVEETGITYCGRRPWNNTICYFHQNDPICYFPQNYIFIISIKTIFFLFPSEFCYL